MVWRRRERLDCTMIVLKSMEFSSTNWLEPDQSELEVSELLLPLPGVVAEVGAGEALFGRVGNDLMSMLLECVGMGAHRGEDDICGVRVVRMVREGGGSG